MILASKREGEDMVWIKIVAFIIWVASVLWLLYELDPFGER